MTANGDDPVQGKAPIRDWRRAVPDKPPPGSTEWFERLRRKQERKARPFPPLEPGQ